MQRWLSPETVVQQDAERCAIVCRDVEIEVTLEAESDDALHPLWVLATAAGCSRREWAMLDVGLRHELVRAHLVTTERPSRLDSPNRDGKPRCEPLTDILAASKGAAPVGNNLEDLLILTPKEVLWVPQLTDTLVANEALRMFVSGLQDSRLRIIYANLVTKHSRTAGGLPVPLEPRDALQRLQRAAHRTPMSLDIDDAGLLHERPERLSVVQTVVFGRLVTADLALTTATATYVLPNLSFASTDDDTYGFGVGSDAGVAEAIARGEATERFAAGDVRTGAVIVATGLHLASKDDDFLDPRLLMRFSDAQHTRNPSLRPWSETQPTAWVVGRRLCNESSVRVPAELVYYPFQHTTVTAYGNLGWATSSGTAAHPNLDQAVRSAWHELVERHGFVSLWLRRRSARQIRLPPESPAAGVLAALERDGTQIVLHDISNHGVTAVLAAARTVTHSLAIGAAAGSGEYAPWKALIEAATSIARWRDRDRPAMTPEAVQRPEDHESLYLSPSAPLEAVEFLFAEDTVVDLAETLEMHVDGVGELPTDLVVCDLSSHLTAPLRVVRCLCPHLLPITFGYDMEPLGMWRCTPPEDLLLERGSGPLIPHPFA